MSAEPGIRAGEPLDDDLFTFVTHHIVVPAAVIAMVASLLSYLVDVRSAFLGGGPQLKWIGFCFAVATVLTERYGHTQGDRDLQGCYTGALGVATVAVLLMEPWETRAVGLGEKSANLLIIGAVWWLATRVTRGLSPEEGRPAGQGARLYGLQRLKMQAWQRQRREETGAPPPAEQPAQAIPANPAMSVARLAAAALVAFALGEPVLLGAAPQTGIRALAAVVIFLFATGIVLAAGSAMDALRRAEWAGGDVSPGLVPGRVALAGGLLAVVLAAALAVPGLHFQGSGRLRPPVAHGQGAETDRGDQEGDQGEGARRNPSEEKGRRGSDSNPQQGRDSLDRPAELIGPAADLIGTLTAAGKWLLIPVVLLLALAGLWALSRLLPRLATGGGRMIERWRALLNRLRDLLGRFGRQALSTGRTTGDPLANLEALALLPPRDAVLAAYHRFLALLESRGYPRPAKSTPYEILNALPFDFRALADPVKTLTDLYVEAAYSAEPVGHDAGQRAILILKGMRGLLAAPAAA
ncbi:MAG TPA: DUF4129 domain-containing protein [Thermoanaerobaculia bacterium]